MRITQGVSAYQGFPACKDCGNQLSNLATDAEGHSANVADPLCQSLRELARTAQEVASSRYWKSGGKDGYNGFSEMDLRQVMEAIDMVLEYLPEGQNGTPVSEEQIAQLREKLPDLNIVR